MKKFKSLLCLLMAAVMLLSLAACGGESTDEKTPGNKEENTPASGFVYVPEFKAVKSNPKDYLRILSADADNVYCIVERVTGEEIPEGAVKEFEGQFDVYEQFLAMMDENGNVKELPEYLPLKPQDSEGRTNYRPSSNIVGLVPRQDGSLMCIENVSASWYEGPEGVEYGSDEYWEYQMYEENYSCRVLNADGSEINSFPLEIPEGSYVNSTSVVLDKDENLVYASDMLIKAVNTQGELVYEIPVEEFYVEKIVPLEDGRIFAFYWGENGPVLSEIDGVNKKLGEAFELPQYSGEIFPGNDGFEFCYTSGLNFYGFNLGEEPVKLFSWMDVDINSDAVRNFVIKPDGSIMALSSEWNESKGNTDYELVKLTKKPADSVPQKQELSLAVMWLDYDFKDSIIKYNRTNDKYRITIKDYSEFNTEDDYNAGLTKLLTEIMSGEMPDMLALSGLPYSQLLSKGIIEDIYPFIDADPELSREDFQQNFFKALEVDGKLGQVCSSFSILTAIGASSVVGTEPGWNYQQFNEALSMMPEGCQPFGAYVARNDILRMGLSMDMELFADWSTGECNFDSPGFVELLNFAAAFPAEIDFDAINMDMDGSDAFASGMQMLSVTGIGSFDDLQYNDVNFGGDATYIGFPSASGNGSAFQPGVGYAITKNCSDKDAAWDFLRTLLTEEYQSTSWFGLPTNQHAFDAKLKKAMTPEYKEDFEGNLILDENGDKIPVSHGGFGMPDGTVFEIYNVTEAQAEKFLQLINSTDKLMDENTKLIEIVIADAAPFFEGQKSAEEVAKLIQSKVNIYINEQR